MATSEILGAAGRIAIVILVMGAVAAEAAAFIIAARVFTS